MCHLVNTYHGKLIIKHGKVPADERKEINPGIYVTASPVLRKTKMRITESGIS